MRLASSIRAMGVQPSMMLRSMTTLPSTHEDVLPEEDVLEHTLALCKRILAGISNASAVSLAKVSSFRVMSL